MSNTLHRASGDQPVNAPPTTRLLAEARAALTDQRYGVFTHPFVLGLLVAVTIVGGEDPERLSSTPCPHPVDAS